MKPHLSIVCALSLGFFCAEIPAQGVYMTRDKNGPVFSDKPQPGSKELKLSPLTVIPALPKPASENGTNKVESPSARPEASQAEREPTETVIPYRKLTVVAPTDGGSVAGDTSFLEVRLAVDPPLQLAEGHAFVARIDDRPVDGRFTTTEFVIPPGFWPEGFLPSNRGMQLDVAIVDSDGQVVMRALSVHFHSRPVMIRSRPYPARPGNYLPPPKTTRPAAMPKNPGRHAPGHKTPKTQFRKD